MRLSDSRDPRGPGILILQHHGFQENGWALDLRGGLLGTRVFDRDDKTGGLGSWIREKRGGNPAPSVGDLNLAFLWQNGSDRPIPGFAWSWPVVTQPNSDLTPTSSGGDVCAIAPSKPSILPIGDLLYNPDKRWEVLNTHTFPMRDGIACWPKFAMDFVGVAYTTTEENVQTEIFMPTDPRQLAVNRKGDMAMGSLVCDMDDGFKIDLTRMARLQSKQWVLKEPKTCNSPIKTNAIAWNIGPTGCEDTRGGFVIERREASTTDVPTGQGGGGSGAPTINDNNSPSNWGGKDTTSPFINLPNGGLAINPLFIGAGGPGAGVGKFGAGGGAVAAVAPPAAVIGAMPMPTNGKGIIAMISHYDSGHSDVGSKTDKHNMGTDADGHPINALHIHTNAYFRRDDTFDAPIEFGKFYINPDRGRYLMPTYLRYDPKPSHPFACGPKPGLWRLESECVARIVEAPGTPPPPPPPPEGPPVETGPSGPPGGGDGGTPPGVPGTPPNTPTVIYVRQWVPGRTDRFSGTDMAFSTGTLIFRPQDLSPNAVDLRQADTAVPVKAQQDADFNTPVTARIEAFGKAQGSEWQRTIGVRKGRFAGGTASGGLVFMPPEFDITDYADNFSRNASILPATSTTYFLGVPGTYYGAGIPVPTTGGMKTGYRWGVNSSGDLGFDAVNSSGTATNVITLSNAGVISFGSSSSISLPAVSSVQMGSGSGTAKIKGLASNSDTTVGNVGAGEDNLKTYTLPANALSSDNNCAHVIGKGKVTGGTSYVLKFHFGSTAVTIFDGPLFFATDYEWDADIQVTRSSSGNQSVKILFTASNTNSTLSGTSYNRLINTTATETDTAAITVKFTGESAGGTDNDITQHFMQVQFYNAP